MSAPSAAHPLPPLAVLPTGVVDHRLANLEAELDAYRAEVERLQIVLNQIHRNALAAKALQGGLDYVVAATLNTLDCIAYQCDDYHATSGPASSRKTPSAEILAKLLRRSPPPPPPAAPEPATLPMPHVQAAALVDQYKAAADRWQQQCGEALQECERMSELFDEIAKYAGGRVRWDGLAPEERLPFLDNSLRHVEDMARDGPPKSRIPF